MKQLLIIITIIFLFSSCGSLYNVEIDCRDFNIDFEKYWATNEIGSQISFVDSIGNEKAFALEFRKAKHTDNYYSDTGCSCWDKSLTWLINDTDTISLWKDSFYQYDNDAEVTEGIYLSFDNNTMTLSDKDKIDRRSLYIGDTLLANCIYYEKEIELNNNMVVVSIILAENYGAVQFVDHNGMKWSIKNINASNEPIKIEDFEFEESECE